MIITQTVGQMTDEKASSKVGTQTPLPQTCLSFSSLTGNASALQPQQQQQSHTKYSPFEQKILENELLLQTQRNALKNIDRILNDKRFADRGTAKTSNDAQSLGHPTNIDQTAVQMVILMMDEHFVRFVFDDIHFGICSGEWKIHGKVRQPSIGMNLIFPITKMICPIYQDERYPKAAHPGIITKSWSLDNGKFVTIHTYNHKNYAKFLYKTTDWLR